MNRQLAFGTITFLALIFGLVGGASSLTCGYVGQEFCQNGQVYRCEKTGSEMTPIFQNRSCTVNVPSLAGTWTGSGHQSPAGQTSDYPIVMTIGEDGGSIQYPSLSCGGSLTRLSSDSTSAQYRETITYGQCINGGTITARLFQGRLSWSWTGQAGGTQYNVIAVLAR